MRGRKKRYEDWPPIIGAHDGVKLSTGQWSSVGRSRGADSDSDYTTSALRLHGVEINATEPLGTVRITRERTYDKNRRFILVDWFRCSVQLFNTALPLAIGQGRCRTWKEAIGVVQDCLMPEIVTALREQGRKIYSPGNWKPIRPFLVVYPYNNADEPNAKFSPFKLIGAWPLQDVEDGVAWQWSPNNVTMRAFAKDHHANAFLTVDDDGEWHVYHRNSMSVGDPIDLSDFYARLIAGSDDDL